MLVVKLVNIEYIIGHSCYDASGVIVGHRVFYVAILVIMLVMKLVDIEYIMWSLLFLMRVTKLMDIKYTVWSTAKACTQSIIYSVINFSQFYIKYFHCKL